MFNPKSISLSSVILYQPPVYESMLSQVDANGVVIRCSDVYLLFNQERLENELGTDTFQKVIDSFNNSKMSDTLSELRKDIPDESLSDFIKSRHFQNPAELKAWAQYLLNNFEDEYDKYQEKRAQHLKEKEEEAKRLRDAELEEYLKRKNAQT